MKEITNMGILAQLHMYREMLQHVMQDEIGKIIILYVVIVLAMLLDFLTGFLQAVVNKNVESFKMSAGMIKKISILLGLVFIVLMGLVLPNAVGGLLIYSMLVLEILNEAVSINENLVKMGVKIPKMDKVIERLKIVASDDEKEKEE